MLIQELHDATQESLSIFYNNFKIAPVSSKILQCLMRNACRCVYKNYNNVVSFTEITSAHRWRRSVCIR